MSRLGSRLRRYGLAVALVTAGSAVSAVMLPFRSDDLLAALLFFPIVTISAWFGGLGPGLAAVAGSALAITYFWLPPRYSFAIDQIADIVALTVFCAMGVLVVALYENRLRQATRVVVALRQSEQRRATMVEVARTLTSQLDLRTVLDAVAEAAVQLFGGEVGFRLLEGDDLVRYRATPGAQQAMLHERLKLGESISGQVAVTGEPVVTEDTAADPRAIIDHRQAHRTPATGALMCVPIRGGSRILGTLNIYRERGHRFDEGALNLALNLAAQAGIALENARLYDEAMRRQREAETLARIAMTLTESLDAATVSQQIVESVHELLRTQSSSLRVLEADGSMRGVAFGGRMREILQAGHVLGAGIGIGALTIATGEPAWTPDALTDPRLTLTDRLREAFERSGVSAMLAVPLRVGGRVIGVLNVADSTGRTFSEADISLLQTFADQAAIVFENARLYREAVEAYRQLSDTQTQLLQAQKMEAVGRLAGGIAHDFNNILTVIRGRAELLQHRLPATDRTRADIEIIAKTTARAALLTRQLLAFSRRQALQRTVLELNAVVSGMHAMLRQLIGEDIAFEAILDPDAGRVLADRGQIEQVLTNLVVNARDAMPNGGHLLLETGHAVLDEVFASSNPEASPGPHAFVRISDTGMGIDPAIQSKIFEPFFTTRAAGQGTGLGLSTVEGVIKQHGGCVSVKSTVGQGSVFTVYLPSTAASPPSFADSGDDVGRARRGSETILVVEDEEGVRELACDILDSAGFTVLAASNGAAALELCQLHGAAIDLLLTDIVMPGMSGTDLAKTVLRSWPAIKILFMSGYPTHPSGHAELVDPDAPMLAKPFSVASLTGMVRERLDAR